MFEDSKLGLAMTTVAIALVVIATTLLAAIGAAAATAASADRPQRASLTELGSCNGLRSYLRRHQRALDTYVTPGIAEDVVAPTATGEGGSGLAAQGAAPVAATENGTNVQEAGVDEPDTVKTVGTTVYAIDGDQLRAVDISGGAPVVTGSVDLPGRPDAGGYPAVDGYQLLVAGGKALAIGQSYGSFSAGYETETVIAEVDVSNPAAMAVLRTARFDGSFVSARLTGPTARVVTSAYPATPVAERGHGRALVPRLTLRDRTTGERSRRKLVECADVRRPSRFAGAELLSVLTIDVAQGLPAVDVDAVLTDGQIVYASPTSLYVATERWIDPGREQAVSGVRTEIHRFDTATAGSTTYVASGKVRGFMLSQWSMSEQDGILRVASTTTPPWNAANAAGPPQSDNFVTSLATDGTALSEVGRLGGLGVGEQIYAVRFIGDVGYVVTFRQVDPLFVLDLSDPSAPTRVGELKVPGYSAYLHPVGDGSHLLGVGQDVSADGVPEGVQVSLFDVSNPAAPALVDQEGFAGDTYTEVEYDHHAFSYFPDQALAAIPIESYYGPEGQFYGAVGLRVDPGGADPLGRIAKLSHGFGYDARITRTLLVGDTFYALSPKGLGAYDPATLTQTAFARF